MFYNIAKELKRLLWLWLVCLIIGLLISQVAGLLIAGTLIYIIYTIKQMAALHAWLDSEPTSTPPSESSGLWGDIVNKVDRTRRKHARETKRLKTIIQRVENTTSAINDAVLLMNDRHTITWWNPAAERLLNLKSNDLGSFIGNYIRNPLFFDYIEQEDYTLPINLPAPQNIDRHFQYQMTHIGNNERLLIVRDVTHLFHLEQMRKDFVANVSHELRTPLTVLQGYLETLSDNNELSPVWQKAMSQMTQQTRRMGMLVNDLTELSKLETDQMEQQQVPVNLRALITRVIDDARAISGEDRHDIRLTLHKDWYLLGSERELYSALSNLLVNAIKYSPANSTIDVLVEQNSLQQLCVHIKDEGLGIEPHHIPRLTERFYRVDASRSIETGGTGLGLAIVKHVLLRHNGQLSIESQLGKGSQFTCCFDETQIVNSDTEQKVMDL